MTFLEIRDRLFFRRVLFTILDFLEQVVDPSICSDTYEVKSGLQLLGQGGLATARLCKNQNSHDLFVSNVNQVVGATLDEVVF